MNQPEPVAFRDPKLAAAALATPGAKFLRADPDGGRLVFFVSGVPNDFAARAMSGELSVRVRDFVSCMDFLLGLIAERQQRGRR